MGRFLLRLFINAGILLLIAQLVPGIHVGTISAVVAALVLGAINAVIRPLLILLTLPVTIVSLGLFLLVINAALFGLAAWLVPYFTVNGFGAALEGSILYWLAGWATSALLRSDGRDQQRITFTVQSGRLDPEQNMWQQSRGSGRVIEGEVTGRDGQGNY